MLWEHVEPSTASPPCKPRMTVRKQQVQIPFSVTHHNYNKVLTTKFRIHWSQNVLALGVTPELLLSKLPARFTKHRQHQYREVQLKATHWTWASLCIYQLQCGIRLGKISVSTAHYWAKQAQRNCLRALEPKYRSCLPLNSFDISVEPKRTFIGQSNTNSRCCKRATSSAAMPRAEGSTSWFIKSWNCLVIFQTPGCERVSTGQLTARKIQVCRQAFDRAATSASLPSDKDHHSPLLFWVGSKIPPFIALEWNKFSLL